MVELADPEKVHHVAVQVVQYLNLRRLFVKEHLRASGECLDIGGVRRKDFDDLFRDSVLAAYVGERANHAADEVGA
jgi:hypothetical protein